ncbi:hypothetical protein FGG78_08940 [Thioclava sp. BHET1]|nr:hypothetical protein FGG78_08940 [Thioclava sp. BHET1]
MSGFAICQMLSGNPAQLPSLLQAVTAAMADRGRDGIAKKTDGKVAMSHLYLDSAGQGPSGLGPWQTEDHGTLLTGDLAIINGRELAQEAGAAYRGDAEAVLQAYARWGLDAIARIEGEFAFGLWDPRSARLIVVRDRFGVKPVAYRVDPDLICVASAPYPLAQLGSQPVRPDAAWIAEYLTDRTFDTQRTAYADVQRLPPGHMMIVERGSVLMRQWWQLEARELSARDAPEALAEALRRAVTRRMRGRTACLLSGGLDSGSITRLAADHAARPVPAYSLRFPGMPEMDEGVYIDALRETGNIEGIDLPALIGGAFDDPDTLLDEHHQPVLGLGHVTTRQLHRRLAQDGMRTVLDGHGGDEVIGMGTWHLDTLARNGNWAALYLACRAHARFSGDTRGPHGLMLELLGHHAPRPLRGALRRLGRAERPDTLSWRALVDPDLAERSAIVANIQTSLRDTHAHLPEHQRFHAALLSNAGTADAFEFFDRAASAQGIELRFPFYDREVVAIALGQPDAAKIAQGRTRAPLRAAMQGILPDCVRLRPDKTDFTPNLMRGLRADPHGHLSRYQGAMPEILEGYVVPDALSALAARLTQDPSDTTAMRRLWRVFWLEQWLMRLSATRQTLAYEGRA